MSKHMERVREMLCDELDKIAETGKLTAGSLETVDKLTHSIKSIDTILAMREAGYSERYPVRYSYGQHRDSMGRYSRTGYSYGGDMAAIMSELRGMANDLPDEKRREVLRFVDAMER